MQFDLNDEQKQLFNTVQALLADAEAGQGMVAAFDDGGYGASPLWPRLRDLGLVGLLAPGDRGGLDDELLTLAVVAEALGFAGAGTPLIHQALAAWVLASSDADQPLVDAVIAGERAVALALGEAPDRWRPEQWAGGDKINVIGAADADLFLVGLAGGDLGLVEAGADGVSVAAVSSLDRLRPMGTLSLADGGVKRLNLGEGMADRLVDALLILDAADAFGAARRAVDAAVEYAKTREQFGRPIGAFQGLKHQLANMALDVEPCRAMVWHAAHAWDRRMADAPRTAALTNAHVTEVAVKSIRAAIEAHGGMGFTWEHPLHVWLKRVMADLAHLGGPIVQRSRVGALSAW
ncbi:MAG: acyl-CoA dehydrogenase [Caulobacter sp.]|nr:acyl-CoA dehydrogenase [Caulobacter sp.]